MNERMAGLVGGRIDCLMIRRAGTDRTDRWIGGPMNRQTDRRTDGSIDRWGTEGCVDLCTGTLKREVFENSVEKENAGSQRFLLLPTLFSTHQR